MNVMQLNQKLQKPRQRALSMKTLCKTCVRPDIPLRQFQRDRWGAVGVGWGGEGRRALTKHIVLSDACLPLHRAFRFYCQPSAVVFGKPFSPSAKRKRRRKKTKVGQAEVFLCRRRRSFGDFLSFVR